MAWLVPLVVVPIFVVAGLLFIAADDGSHSSAEADGPVAASITHVHGLGINPTDDALFIATHSGAFRMPSGGVPERVGDNAQDTMGFTVVGGDSFVGSGHPDLAAFEDGQPSHLGLIESTDAGRSWRSVSLSGEADFHALVASDERIYGWDATSSQLMVSGDGREWDVRSTIDLYGFAVDPQEAERLIAATPEGVRQSDDGGRTWSSASSPEAVVVSWAPDGDVWVAEAEGTLHRSSDRGATWSRVGTLGAVPQALLATSEGLWAATADDADVTSIVFSADDGETWDLRHRGNE